MNNVDTQYLDLCQHILDNGVQKGDRTGTGTLSVFGYQMRFNLQDGFPLLTTKRVPFRLIATELLWFLSGSTNVYDLLKQNNDIWLPDAFRIYKERGGHVVTIDEYKRMLLAHKHPTDFGDLGPIYGRQWRSWKGRDEYVDQIKTVIKEIKNNPDSRRLLVTAWNVGELHIMGLPPCHYAFQFYVANGKLSCMFSMRSNDVFLGLPFNIASYALLTHLVAIDCGLEVGEVIYTGADVHIYNNHIEQVKEQLKRKPRSLPELRINPAVKNIDDFTIDDFEIINYNPHPTIKGEVSVG